MGGTPAGKRFVTKLLPSCYTSVTLRVHNGCPKARCSFPFHHTRGTGFSTLREGKKAGGSSSALTDTGSVATTVLAGASPAQPKVMTTGPLLCSQVIERGYHMAVRNARLHEDLAAGRGPKLLSVALIDCARTVGT